MKATFKEICEQFSEGNFPFCYEYFSPDIEWKIAGGESTKTREHVIAYCDKMMKEMTASTLKNTNIVAQNEDVAIEGICYYTNSDNRARKLMYCDVFHFKNDRIASITSYCIESKV